MSLMHIGLDITSLMYGRGVSRYTSNLARSLTKLKMPLTLYGYGWGGHASLLHSAQEIARGSNTTSIKIRKLPPSVVGHAWRWGFLPITKQIGPVDVFHAWDWQVPPDQNICMVSTIHDLAILKFPQTAHPTILKHHQHVWKELKKRQAHIIAVSRATKKDIVELLGIPQYLVHVVPEALPQEVRDVGNHLTEEKYQDLVKKLRLFRPYILFVGTREPRKNLLRLIEAWKPLRSEVDLVIAGEEGWDGTATVKQMSELRFLGRVSDEELSVLYSEATCFAYPSLYEGFGLPILEAFQYGTPVVTSNTSSMPEVAGNAAVLVDPFSVEDIRSGLSTVLSEDIAAQQVRLQRMIIRQHMFNWDSIARETSAVYHKAYEDFHS